MSKKSSMWVWINEETADKITLENLKEFRASLKAELKSSSWLTRDDKEENKKLIEAFTLVINCFDVQ